MYSLHTGNMSEWPTCPKCKTGVLRPDGRRGIDAEPEGEFRQTASAIDLVCDNASCRHKQPKREMNEYVGSSEKLSRTVTPKDDSNESPSDA